MEAEKDEMTLKTLSILLKAPYRFFISFVRQTGPFKAFLSRYLQMTPRYWQPEWHVEDSPAEQIYRNVFQTFYRMLFDPMVESVHSVSQDMWREELLSARSLLDLCALYQKPIPMECAKLVNALLGNLPELNADLSSTVNSLVVENLKQSAWPSLISTTNFVKEQNTEDCLFVLSEFLSTVGTFSAVSFFQGSMNQSVQGKKLMSKLQISVSEYMSRLESVQGREHLLSTVGVTYPLLVNALRNLTSFLLRDTPYDLEAPVADLLAAIKRLKVSSTDSVKSRTESNTLESTAEFNKRYIQQYLVQDSGDSESDAHLEEEIDIQRHNARGPVQEVEQTEPSRSSVVKGETTRKGQPVKVKRNGKMVVSEEAKRERKYKNKKKAASGNHSRKRGAMKKSTRGMF